VLASILGLCVGAFPVTLDGALRAAGKLVTGGAPSTPEERVLLAIRGPRVRAGLMTGAALAAAGVVYQGLFRNPLVSPDVLGVSAGAGLLFERAGHARAGTARAVPGVSAGAPNACAYPLPSGTCPPSGRAGSGGRSVGGSPLTRKTSRLLPTWRRGPSGRTRASRRQAFPWPSDSAAGTSQGAPGGSRRSPCCLAPAASRRRPSTQSSPSHIRSASCFQWASSSAAACVRSGAAVRPAGAAGV
jgi:hypothetical protein